MANNDVCINIVSLFQQLKVFLEQIIDFDSGEWSRQEAKERMGEMAKTIRELTRLVGYSPYDKYYRPRNLRQVERKTNYREVGSASGLSATELKVLPNGRVYCVQRVVVPNSIACLISANMDGSDQQIVVPIDNNWSQINKLHVEPEEDIIYYADRSGDVYMLWKDLSGRWERYRLYGKDREPEDSIFPIDCLKVLPSGEIFFSRSDNKLRRIYLSEEESGFVDEEAGELGRSGLDHANSIDYLPNGDLVCATNRDVTIWSKNNTNKWVKTGTVCEDPVNGVQVVNQKTIAAHGFDGREGNLTLLSLDVGEDWFVEENYKTDHLIHSFQYLPDGRFIISTGRGLYSIEKDDNGDWQEVVLINDPAPGGGRPFQVLADGRIIFGGNPGSNKAFRVFDGDRV